MADSLGKTLKKKRESKTLSMQEVSERTRISRDIIASIEEDRLDKLPSLFYARGFVKTYAQFLGITEEKAVKDFLSGQEKKDVQKLHLESLDKKAPTGALFKRYKREIALFVLIIFGIWFSVFTFMQIRKAAIGLSAKRRSRVAEKEVSKKEGKEVSKKEEKKVVREAPKPEEPVELAEPRLSENTVEEETAAIKLEIEANRDTWIQVLADGRLLFRGILVKGASDTWQADKEIDLELGNAGGVNLKLNEKNLGSPGKKGEKKKFIATQLDEKLVFKLDEI